MLQKETAELTNSITVHQLHGRDADTIVFATMTESSSLVDPDLPHRVLAACLAVHEHLGPGLSRDAYEECLALELREMELLFRRGDPLRFHYRGKAVEAAGRMDLVVEDGLLVQVFAAREVTSVDVAGVESYLRLSGLRLGLLVNFNVEVLRKGVHRVTLKRRSEPSN